MRADIIAVSVVAGGIAIIAATDRMDTAFNYTEVTAVVSDVKAQCYLESIDDKVVVKTTTTTDTLSCEEADELRLTHPAYLDYKTKGGVKVKFEYISPADNQQHSNWFWIKGDLAENRKLKSGDEIQIYASKETVRKVKQL
ncbi:MAG: hypothetical protein ABI668_09220 [Sphingorhabdus sp.]